MWKRKVIGDFWGGFATSSGPGIPLTAAEVGAKTGPAAVTLDGAVVTVPTGVAVGADDVVATVGAAAGTGADGWLVGDGTATGLLHAARRALPLATAPPMSVQDRRQRRDTRVIDSSS